MIDILQDIYRALVIDDIPRNNEDVYIVSNKWIKALQEYIREHLYRNKDNTVESTIFNDFRSMQIDLVDVIDKNINEDKENIVLLKDIEQKKKDVTYKNYPIKTMLFADIDYRIISAATWSLIEKHLEQSGEKIIIRLNRKTQFGKLQPAIFLKVILNHNEGKQGIQKQKTFHLLQHGLLYKKDVFTMLSKHCEMKTMKNLWYCTVNTPTTMVTGDFINPEIASSVIVEYLEDPPFESPTLELKTADGDLIGSHLSQDLIQKIYGDITMPNRVHGLMNLTNTCYMNSVFQMLVKIPNILSYYLKTKPEYEEDDIAKEFRKFVQQYNASKNTVLSPTSLVHSIKELNSEYNNFRQNDSSALMDYIINHIHEDMEIHLEKETYIHEHFFGENEITITCGTCGNQSSRKEEFLTLNLPIPSPPSSLRVKVYFTDKLPTLYKIKTDNNSKFGDVRETMASLLNVSKSTIILTQVKYYDIDIIFSDDDMVSSAVVKTILAYVIPELESSKASCILPVTFSSASGLNVQNMDPQIIFYDSEKDSEASLYDRVFRNISNYFVDEIIDKTRMAGYFPYIKDPSLPPLSDTDSIWGSDTIFSLFSKNGEPMGYHQDRNVPKLQSLSAVFDDGFLEVILDPEKIYTKYNIDESIHVPIEHVEPYIPTIQECLNLYLTPTIFQGDNKYHCEMCNGEVEKAYEEHTIKKLPSTLIITFTRFNYKYGEKTTKKFEKIGFPLHGFDLSSYCPNSTTYDLQSVSNHNGGVDSGHYYTYTRGSNSQPWYLFDDTFTERVHSPEDVICSSEAYVLVYINTKDM